MKECLVTGHTHLHTEKEDTWPLPFVFFILFYEVTTLVLAVFNSEQTTNTIGCVPYAWQYCLKKRRKKKKKRDLGSCLHIYLVHRLLRHEIHPPRAVWQQILARACSKVAIRGGGGQLGMGAAHIQAHMHTVGDRPNQMFNHVLLLLRTSLTLSSSVSNFFSFPFLTCWLKSALYLFSYLLEKPEIPISPGVWRVHPLKSVSTGNLEATSHRV